MADTLPNTNDATVMRMAIAWEIVTRAHYENAAPRPKPNELQKTLTDEYIQTYNRLLQEEQTPKG